MDYSKIFEELCIEIKPLPNYYTPDRFASEIMKKSTEDRDVSYATTISCNGQKVSYQ